MVSRIFLSFVYLEHRLDSESVIMNDVTTFIRQRKRGLVAIWWMDNRAYYVQIYGIELASVWRYSERENTRKSDGGVFILPFAPEIGHGLVFGFDHWLPGWTALGTCEQIPGRAF